MKRQFILVFLSVTVIVTSGSLTNVYGQWYGGGGGGGYGGYGGWGMGWGGAAGGVGEIYSGMGNLVRSEGQRNLLNAEAEKQFQQAAQEHEKARTLHVENQQKIHAEMQKRKREAKAQDAQDLQDRLAARDRQQAFLDAHKPQPLATTQFNPKTASIDWPPALRSADFDDARNSIESLFQNRSKYGATTDSTRDINRAVGALKDQLRSQILKIPGSDYSEARRFLDRLAVTIL